MVFLDSDLPRYSLSQLQPIDEFYYTIPVAMLFAASAWRQGMAPSAVHAVAFGFLAAAAFVYVYAYNAFFIPAVLRPADSPHTTRTCSGSSPRGSRTAPSRFQTAPSF